MIVAYVLLSQLPISEKEDDVSKKIAMNRKSTISPRSIHEPKNLNQSEDPMSTEKFTVWMFNISTVPLDELDVKHKGPGMKREIFSSKQEALNFAEQNAKLYYKVIVKDLTDKTITVYREGKPV
jgi:hypothetical protein